MTPFFWVCYKSLLNTSRWPAPHIQSDPISRCYCINSALVEVHWYNLMWSNTTDLPFRRSLLWIDTVNYMLRSYVRSPVVRDVSNILETLLTNMSVTEYYKHLPTPTSVIIKVELGGFWYRYELLYWIALRSSGVPNEVPTVFIGSTSCIQVKRWPEDQRSSKGNHSFNSEYVYMWSVNKVYFEKISMFINQFTMYHCWK